MAFLSNSRENEQAFTLATPFSTATGTSRQLAVNYTVPANGLRRNGQSLRLKAWGTTASNSHNKTFDVKFGPTGSETTLFTSGTTTLSGKDWYLECTLTRCTSATQVSGAAMWDNTPAVTAIVCKTTSSLTVDLTAANQLELGLTDGTSAAGDIVVYGATIEGLSD